MVSLQVGTESTNVALEGQSVQQVLNSLRDGKLDGINTRLEAGSKVDVLVNDVNADMDTVIEKDDRVEILQNFTQGQSL